jgi:hypothetical protein
MDCTQQHYGDIRGYPKGKKLTGYVRNGPQLTEHYLTLYLVNEQKQVVFCIQYVKNNEERKIYQ